MEETEETTEEIKSSLSRKEVKGVRYISISRINSSE
jgi:hypothetical protein